MSRWRSPCSTYQRVRLTPPPPCVRSPSLPLLDGPGGVFRYAVAERRPRIRPLAAQRAQLRLSPCESADRLQDYCRTRVAEEGMDRLPKLARQYQGQGQPSGEALPHRADDECLRETALGRTLRIALRV